MEIAVSKRNSIFALRHFGNSRNWMTSPQQTPLPMSYHHSLHSAWAPTASRWSPSQSLLTDTNMSPQLLFPPQTPPLLRLLRNWFHTRAAEPAQYPGGASIMLAAAQSEPTKINPCTKKFTTESKNFSIIVSNSRRLRVTAPGCCKKILMQFWKKLISSKRTIYFLSKAKHKRLSQWIGKEDYESSGRKKLVLKQGQRWKGWPQK